MSPVGPYYPGGLAPTQIKVIDNYVRAVAGGLGEAKTSANYAASLYAAEEAKHEGFTQVLWLDGVQHKYIEEVGTSNIMLQIRDEVITPPLGGTILAGVTRDSVLTLLRSWGVRVSERQITIDEVVAAAGDGTLKEVWATGTAAVISPVGELAYKGRRSWSTRAGSVSWPRSCTTRSWASNTARRPIPTVGLCWCEAADER